MKIAVLLSGGVDSSVALYNLKQKGYEITAFYLKIWLEDELAYLGNCPWEEDLYYVKKTCELLGIKFEIVPMQREYWNSVVSYMIDSIKKGYTPNPDMLCNRNVKLGAFLNLYKNDFDCVATGHYARRLDIDGKMFLAMTKDIIKDQTYFLAYTPYESLSRAIFPIGDMTKEEVRHVAVENKLPTAERPDSQGICFLGKIKINEFLKHHFGEKIGDIIEVETGKILKQHNGYWFYTIGQRQGIGLSSGPWYVVKKDCVKNIIYVSKCLNKNTDSDEFMVFAINWLVDEDFKKSVFQEGLFVKIRHGAKLYNANLIELNIDEIKIKINGKDQGISSGQFCVFYNKDKICLGSGIIRSENNILI